LTDVVKEIGEPAFMNFGTYGTAPDFLHHYLNGTTSTLVSSGNTSKAHQTNQRVKVTSVHIRPNHAYNVTVKIFSVRPQDAGTYSAWDWNGVDDSMKNDVELIVIGNLDCD